MNTITISEFKNLIANKDWHREQKHEVVGIDPRCEKNASGRLVATDVYIVWGFASKTSILNGIEITYAEAFEHEECNLASLTTTTERIEEEVWHIDGVNVVDEDGNWIDPHDLAEFLPADFSSIDYSGLSAEKELFDYTLEIDNEPDIHLVGELIASVKSSEQTGRWTELNLYRTKGGKFVCHQIGRTKFAGERDRFSGKVCETINEVKAFFGHRWLAKELYLETEINDVVEVE